MTQGAHIRPLRMPARYRCLPSGYRLHMRHRIGDWLRVELRSQGSTCKLILSGELCGTSIAALEAQVDQLGSIPFETLVIDVRRLTDLDAAGASVLLGLYYYAAAKGARLEMIGEIVSPGAERVCANRNIDREVTGTWD